MGSSVRFTVYCTCQRLRRIATQLESRCLFFRHIAEIGSHGPRALGIPFSLPRQTFIAGVILAIALLHILRTEGLRGPIIGLPVT